MNRSFAESLRDVVLRCSSILDASAQTIVGRCGPEDAKQYRRLVGRVMGYSFTNILSPIFAEHPDLEPASFRGAENDAGAQAGPPPPEPAELSKAISDVRSQLERLKPELIAHSAGDNLRDGLDEILVAVDDVEAFVNAHPTLMAT